MISYSICLWFISLFPTAFDLKKNHSRKLQEYGKKENVPRDHCKSIWDPLPRESDGQKPRVLWSPACTWGKEVRLWLAKVGGMKGGGMMEKGQGKWGWLQATPQRTGVLWGLHYKYSLSFLICEVGTGLHYYGTHVHHTTTCWLAPEKSQARGVWEQVYKSPFYLWRNEVP